MKSQLFTTTLRSIGLMTMLSLPAVAMAESASSIDDAKRQRGEYLVSTSACHDCHTPFTEAGEPDMSRKLSGHPQAMTVSTPPKLEAPWLSAAAATNTAWFGPWGISFTANLTPDLETGLGRWSEQDFIATIRSGRHLGRGREILPPMPIPVYRNFTDADLAAIFSYLQSIPAVSNRVPDPLPPLEHALPTEALE